jgi:hypothetical protein
MDQASFFCPRCQQFRLFQSKPMNHTPHILASIFLCGLYLPVWIILALIDQPAWVCAFCGYHDKTQYLEDPTLKQRETQIAQLKGLARSRRNEERKDWPMQRATVFVQVNAFAIALIGILVLLVIGGMLAAVIHVD